MNKQEFLEAIEKANTEEEIISLAKTAGMSDSEIHEMLENADTYSEENSQEDELQEEELDSVAGGFLHFIIVYYAHKKIKAIRKEQYRRGYDATIMSDNRVDATCEK